MKITNIECLPVQAPGRTLVPIIVETDEGITGVGEAGLQRRWYGITGIVNHLKQWLIGEDPDRIEHLWQKMFRGGFYPADKLIGSAIAGIDVALWDIKGKVLGVPVYQLLGGRCRDYVQCFLSPTYHPSDTGEKKKIELDDPDSYVELAKSCIKNKHMFFRLGLPNDGNYFEPRQAVLKLITILKTVRRAVGHDIELMVDLHGRLDPPEAIWFCREVEELGMYLVEDPIRSEYVQAYRNIRKSTRVPLAAGEQWSSKWDFRQCIEEDLIDYARVDISIACGLSEAKKIAALAETHYIKILPHNPLGPVNTAAALHLDLACSNAGPQEVVFPPHDMLPDVFECAFRLEGTRLTVPDKPGIGVAFNREAALLHPAEMTEPPHFIRADGSFTNY